MNKVLIVTAFLASAAIAHADTPFETEVTCPIGGEVYTVIDAYTCTSYTDRTMSFARLSSCDTITRLHQCPSNFLPVYKPFTPAEIEVIEDFMQSESYENAVDQSRYYLAYLVHGQVGGTGASSFGLLLAGLWYDPENTYSDPLYMDAFLFESASKLNHTPAGDLPYFQALVAFAYLKAGDRDMAQDLLEKARGASISDGILPVYIDAITSCMQDMNSTYCDPQTVISPE